MYSFLDEKEKTKEIQRYLNLTQSGNRDDKLTNAVKGVQSRHNITENGEINAETFNAIYLEYRDKRDEMRAEAMLGDSLPIRLGEWGEAMRNINLMLIKLAAHYRIQTNLVNSDYYGERSEKIIEELSEIYHLERAKKLIDFDIYLLLKRDFDTLSLL